jgi:hypothetical protein
MARTALPRQLRKVADKELLQKLEIGLDKVELQLIEEVKHTDPIAMLSYSQLIDAGG